LHAFSITSSFPSFSNFALELALKHSVVAYLSTAALRASLARLNSSLASSSPTVASSSLASDDSSALDSSSSLVVPAEADLSRVDMTVSIASFSSSSSSSSSSLALALGVGVFLRAFLLFSFFSFSFLLFFSFFAFFAFGSRDGSASLARSRVRVIAIGVVSFTTPSSPVCRAACVVVKQKVGQNGGSSGRVAGRSSASSRAREPAHLKHAGDLR
jgi:hypothetical protein